MVGGSPSNIAIGTSRLGLRSIAFTAVGDDRVGDYVLRYFSDEGVITDHVVRKPGKLTSLALLGVQPPDHFPLSFYREDPADIHLTVADAAELPFASVRALMLSGNAFSRGTCADAARYCAEQGKSHGLTAYMDLDLRPTDWSDPRAYGLTLRSVFPHVDVVIGTEEEFFAALADHPDSVVAGSPLLDTDHGELDRRLTELLSNEVVEVIVLKRGSRGVTVMTAGEAIDVPGFPVAVVNTVGAGDSFASGLIRSRLAGWGWRESARFANACGAIVVTRHGCSAAFPTEDEVMSFTGTRGGL
jgi:5-dehydro-2-deoxygluconokinase